KSVFTAEASLARNDLTLPPTRSEASKIFVCMPLLLRMSATYKPATPAPITPTVPSYRICGPGSCGSHAEKIAGREGNHIPAVSVEAIFPKALLLFMACRKQAER